MILVVSSKSTRVSYVSVNRILSARTVRRPLNRTGGNVLAGTADGGASRRPPARTAIGSVCRAASARRRSVLGPGHAVDGHLWSRGERRPTVGQLRRRRPATLVRRVFRDRPRPGRRRPGSHCRRSRGFAAVSYTSARMYTGRVETLLFLRTCQTVFLVHRR